MRNLIASLIFICASCGSKATQSNLRDSNIPPSDKKLHISVEHIAPTRWKASYQFDQPISSLIFWTDVPERKKSWLIESPVDSASGII